MIRILMLAMCLVLNLAAPVLAQRERPEPRGGTRAPRGGSEAGRGGGGEERRQPSNLEGLKKAFPADANYQQVMMPMRDGVKLITEIFVPPGKGKWPTLLIRTPYSRFDTRVANPLKRGEQPTYDFPYVAVTQNQRGIGGSEGKGSISFANEVEDSYDCVEWIAAQEWSDGRVVMTGASGSGISAAAAIFSKAPHLYAVVTNVTGDDFYQHFGFYNGVRRYLCNWISARKVQIPEWPKPFTMPYDVKAREAYLANAAKDNHVIVVYNTGWFDCLGEGAQDAFTALLGKGGKIWGGVGGGGHGAIGGRPVPPPRQAPARQRQRDEYLSANHLKDLIRGTAQIPRESVVSYTLMGDFTDPDAPGNLRVSTKVWPVPSTPTAYHFNQDGKLTLAPPKEPGASLTFTHDPRNPVPTLGGRYMYGADKCGPHDQRPLAGRKDILRFETEPLKEPVGIVGNIEVELYVSADVKDTTFVVTLIDVYPDGYEAWLADGPMMARYHQGLDRPAPLEKGKVYRLKFQLWGTAIVFNKGHQIKVIIAGSSHPAYEVHPNTYQPVNSYDASPVAKNTVHLSPEHPSKIILPVISPDIYKK